MVVTHEDGNEDEFLPPDDFGMSNAGATMIEYQEFQWKVGDALSGRIAPRFDLLCFKTVSNSRKLLKCRLEIIGDVLCQHVGFREVVAVFQRLITQPEQVEAGLIPRRQLLVVVASPPALCSRLGPRGLAFVPIHRVEAGDKLVEV